MHKDDMRIMLGVIFLVWGLVQIAAGIFSWEWVLRYRKLRFLSLFGRTGGRVAVGILGAVFSVLGILIVSGVLNQTETGREQPRRVPIIGTVTMEITGISNRAELNDRDNEGRLS